MIEINKAWSVIIYAAIVAILFLTIFYVSTHQNELFSMSSGAQKKKEIIEHVDLRIIGPTWTIEYLDVTTTNSTAADLLFECAEYYDLSVEKEYWEGYNSYLIDSINNTSNGEDGLFWQYYVNDEYVDVGCSNYLLDDYDQIEWRFVSSAWQDE